MDEVDEADDGIYVISLYCRIGWKQGQKNGKVKEQGIEQSGAEKDNQTKANAIEYGAMVLVSHCTEHPPCFGSENLTCFSQNFTSFRPSKESKACKLHKYASHWLFLPFLKAHRHRA